MLITSKDNNRIKEVRKLLNKKYSLQKGLFVIEGENFVEEAIKNDLLVELFVRKGWLLVFKLFAIELSKLTM